MTSRLLWEQEMYLPPERKDAANEHQEPRPPLRLTNLLAVVLREFNRRKS